MTSGARWTPDGDPLAALGLASAAFVATVVLTWPLIRILARRRLGKTIRSDGPRHGSKAGTPTMGGLGMLAVVLAGGGVLALGETGTRTLAPVLAATAGFGALGLLDDLYGLGQLGGRGHAGIGLTARQMLALQAIVASAVAGAIAVPGPKLLGILLAVVVLMASANGVNITDGLDGLAAGLMAIAFLAQGIIVARGGGPEEAAYLCLVAAGASAGFLVYNRHPARVFMGNVAAMAFGALLGSLALVTGTWAQLGIVAAVFIAEIMSDVLQIGYFKATGGRRILRMAPLHHHFEMGGHRETTIVHWFWLAGAAAGLVAIFVTGQ